MACVVPMWKQENIYPGANFLHFLGPKSWGYSRGLNTFSKIVKYAPLDCKVIIDYLGHFLFDIF